MYAVELRCEDPGRRVPLGRTVATPAALELLDRLAVNGSDLIARHERGDWGQLSAEDWERNEIAFREGERLLSNYPLPGGECVWIITEWDRSVTTILLPSDY